ncbi:rhomboid family intramembrane serine protease [Agriterribacter sp.]|uniref:rhomboid family intramembrane serine protease n=1 Tax=Agriterribacter sp. TaxID=2821509 RepID=UPI002B7173E8|nr:rhomboid family intramembrane serine protease [Agriterribacter sp.]HTN07971.1 rhomboid family intramembrane serine protease [Agriterribacter sp.]
MTEFRPGGFQVLPVVVKNLLIINGLVFLAQVTFEQTGMGSLENLFALHDVHSVYFRPHQLVTHLFMHGSLGHIFFNMFALWMFGNVLENYWGAKRFLIFYIACGLGAGILHLGVLYYENIPVMELFHSLPALQQEELLYSPNFKVNIATVGASGAVFGCLAAFGYLFPNSLIYLYFFIPIKAKWFVLMYAAMEFFMGVRNSAGDNVAHWAHLGGALVGFLLVLYWNKTSRRKFY